ncbi:MAG: hypothetical protein V1827_01115 [Candidatus Micrarchaeota archaeon]
MAQKHKRRDHETAFADRFRKYAPEDGQIVRTKSQGTSATMEAIRKAWFSFRFIDPSENGGINLNSGDYTYFKVIFSLAILKNVTICPKDVSEFSLAIKEFENEDSFPLKAGLFLSALVALGPIGEYVIMTNHLEKRLDGLGYRNTKKKIIRIQGDAGDFLGDRMRGGRIIVMGNAGDSIGSYMISGKIIVEGNAGNDTGYAMFGGVIIIKGDTGKRIGYDSDGGVIRLEGGYLHIKNPREWEEHNCNARIFHKGKLIHGGDSG